MNEKVEPEVLVETKYLNLVKRGDWVFAQRPAQISVVAIVAVTTDRKLVLVEQYRTPTNSRVIELPAGLAGDIVGEENESLQTAAERELLEETGYAAAKWEQLPIVVSSAGLTDERQTLFRASLLTKVGSGGGVDSEDITVHEIPLDEVETWIADRVKSGADVDGRVYAALYFSKEN